MCKLRHRCIQMLAHLILDKENYDTISLYLYIYIHLYIYIWLDSLNVNMQKQAKIGTCKNIWYLTLCLKILLILKIPSTPKRERCEDNVSLPNPEVHFKKYTIFWEAFSCVLDAVWMYGFSREILNYFIALAVSVLLYRAWHIRNLACAKQEIIEMPTTYLKPLIFVLLQAHACGEDSIRNCEHPQCMWMNYCRRWECECLLVNAKDNKYVWILVCSMVRT